VSIFGTAFASGNYFATVVPMEWSLGGTSVRIGSENAPLYFVGPTQINAQVPFTATVGETVSIVVNANGKLTAPQSYLIAPAQPGIFTGAVIDVQNKTVVTVSNPAQIGHDLVLYSNGLGLVSQVCPAEGFDHHVLEIATRLAQGPTAAYGRAKALFEASGEASLEAQLDAEAAAISNMALTRDFQEGIRAFAQKRRPWFQGR